jgi:hypothetical protein
MNRNLVLMLSIAAITSPNHLPILSESQESSDFQSAPREYYVTNSSTVSNDLKYSLEKIRENKRRLDSFLKLEQNWNGYDGMSFEEELISKVKKILSRLEYQPDVSPTGRASIQMDIEKDDDNLVEIEISIDQVSCYSVINGIETEENIELNQIEEKFGQLYA